MTWTEKDCTLLIRLAAIITSGGGVLRSRPLRARKGTDDPPSFKIRANPLEQSRPPTMITPLKSEVARGHFGRIP